MLPELDKFEVKSYWQKAYLNSFLELGWPSSKNEEWKFTSLDRLIKKPFKIALNPEGVVKYKSAPDIKDSYKLIFRNGIFDSHTSKNSNPNFTINNLLEDDSAFTSNVSAFSQRSIISLSRFSSRQELPRVQSLKSAAEQPLCCCG